ncbi:MAG: FHA domain-containing protein [Caldisericum sp.]
MGRGERMYYNAVIGGIGGLLGWLLVELSYSLSSLNIFFTDVICGGLIGASIGILIGSIEGIFSKSFTKILKGGLSGLNWGVLGGALGLVVGEILLTIAKGGIFVRGIGWSIFGILVGISEGRANRDPKKTNYGAIGGIIGGFIGGIFFEAIYRFLGNQVLSRAIGFVILGACMGYFIFLVPILLRSAWLMETAGRYEGREYALTKEITTIGRDERCDIGLFGDPAIAQKHAEVRQEKGKFVLYPLVPEGKTFLDDNEVLGQAVLKERDRIKIGQRVMIFYEKSRRKE